MPDTPNFQLVVEASPTAIVLVNESGEITLVNVEAERLFGYRREEMIGHPIEMLIPHRFRGDHPERRAGFFASPSTRAMGAGRDLYGLRRDGTEVPVEIGLRPLNTTSGNFVLAAIVNITERKQAERERERYTRDLKKSNQDLEDFAYIASHDLRSPLRAIDNLATWVIEDSLDKLPDESAKHLLKIKQRTTRMNNLLDDLLEYSRAGRQHGKMLETDTVKLVRDIVDLLAVPPGFTITIDPGLPTLNTLKTPLETCLRNLISNAIKHHDREDGQIAISCEDRGAFVLFSVSDDGPGIEHEFHSRIFKIFQTLKPRDQQEGSGTGLAIIKKTVEMYGGAVTIESTMGSGTTFGLTWPKTINL